MKKLIVLLAVALAIPTSAALAKGKPSKPGKSAPTVMYVLKGTLSGYTPYDSATSTNGSITIVVKKCNHHCKALKGATLTFTGEVTVDTQVKLHKGATSITDGDKGIVKVRALKKIDPSALQSTLESTPVSKIRDKGAPKT
jgi:hypothetical protein